MNSSINTESGKALSQKKEGQLPLIEELYDKYSPVLFGLATKITGNVQKAEDVLVEAFAEIGREIDKIQSDPNNICRCLLAIVRRIALQKISYTNAIHRPSNYVNTHELIDAFKINERENLNSQSDSILELILYGGLSITQAAEFLQISLKEASQLLRREVNQYRKTTLK